MKVIDRETTRILFLPPPHHSAPRLSTALFIFIPIPTSKSAFPLPNKSLGVGMDGWMLGWVGGVIEMSSWQLSWQLAGGREGGRWIVDRGEKSGGKERKGLVGSVERGGGGEGIVGVGVERGRLVKG